MGGGTARRWPQRSTLIAVACLVTGAAIGGYALLQGLSGSDSAADPLAELDDLGEISLGDASPGGISLGNTGALGESEAPAFDEGGFSTVQAVTPVSETLELPALPGFNTDFAAGQEAQVSALQRTASLAGFETTAAPESAFNATADTGPVWLEGVIEEIPDEGPTLPMLPQASDTQTLLR